ncbi:MAG: polyphosphate kinase 1 [Rhodocyclaceae bacterium]|nr:polyphosphate kinase 1 [Rhodocyclaceae bacterium]
MELRPPPTPVDLKRNPPHAGIHYDHSQFLNRELGLLAFNRRVQEKAENPETPLLERLRYLCITTSNLDEFFEVRIGSLKNQIEERKSHPGPDGMSPGETLQRVAREAHELVERQYRLFNETLIPALAAEDIVFLRRALWNEAQNAWVAGFFEREVAPVLTPIVLDPAHPFPRLLNKSLNFAVTLQGTDAFGRKPTLAIVQAPRVLARVIRLPDAVGGHRDSFVFLSSIIHAHVADLFPGMEIGGCYQFRVTRNAELQFEEDEVANLRTALQGGLPQRRFADAVRLEVVDTCPADVSDFLLRQFGLERSDLYQVDGPVNLVRLMQVPDMVERPDLKFPPFSPGLPKVLRKSPDLFATIRQQDVLLHHPFQSFQPVIDFISQAASDPDVVAIKQTVYRTGHDSALMEALLTAAQRGKEVTVVVELMARFDEETNINWAQRFEDAGAHVVYGVFGFKTHAKMALVIRREQGGLRRYAHLGTGNYHARTAKLYTDFGLFTGDPALTRDVAGIFGQLTGTGRPAPNQLIWQAPFDLHSHVVRAIDREAEHARAGRPAHIIAKMNALLEPEAIEALYRASQAGVRIDLIVRGVCALRPDVPGLSENIRVRSVIGRFLEHSRIFYFRNDRDPDLYLSSADWMDRNFHRRVEVCFPVRDRRLKERVLREGIRPYLNDNTQAWLMDADGNYRLRQPRRGARRIVAQHDLLQTLAEADGGGA